MTAALAGKETRRGLKRFGGRPVYVYASPVLRDERPVGALLVALDAEPMVEAEWRLWRDNGVRFLVLVVVLSGIALLIVRITVGAAADQDGPMDQGASPRHAASASRHL